MTKDKTVTMSRALFQAANPVPCGVFWSEPDSRYMTNMVHLNCLEYQGKWLGWQSAMSAAPVVERQCCTPTPEEEQLLANGDYTPEELWGGMRPTCPNCIKPEPPAPVAVVLPEKYDDVLIPFVAMMRKELHANAGKGDRPGWLSMSSDTALLEIIYHFGKLQASVKRGDEDGIREYAADVANMSMMLADICGCLDKVKELNQ